MKRNKNKIKLVIIMGILVIMSGTINAANDWNSTRSNKTSKTSSIDIGTGDTQDDVKTTTLDRKRPGRVKYGDITLKRTMESEDGLEEKENISMEKENGGGDVGDNDESANNHNTSRSNKRHPIVNPDGLYPDGVVSGDTFRKRTVQANGLGGLAAGFAKLEKDGWKKIDTKKITENGNRAKTQGVVAHVKRVVKKKLFWIFSIEVEEEAEINTDGNIVNLDRPWWSIFAW